MAADVVVLDMSYPDLTIEEEVLGAAGLAVGRVDGSSPEDVRACSGNSVIISGSRARFDAAALAELDVRAIVRAGIGVDTIDLKAAAAAGITICNVPSYGTESVAQHALAMALAGMRRLIEADAMARRGEWGFASTRPMHLPGTSTAGLIGLGRIGSRVGELFSAVGFGNVIGHDPHVTSSMVALADLDTVLATADVISLHVPGNADASPVIGARELSLMKSGSVIVNTARGSLIDEVALINGLKQGRPRIAALDVFAIEPPDMSPYREVEERLILSPHQAWYTEESQETLRRQSAEEALRILKGENPLNVVRSPEENR